MNYEELEGKEIIVIEDRLGECIEWKGIVSGCDPDILLFGGMAECAFT